MVYSFLNVLGYSEHRADQLPARRITQARRDVYQFACVQTELSNDLYNKCYFRQLQVASK